MLGSGISLQAQILGDDEDVDPDEFTWKKLSAMDSRYALSLAERKLTTILMSGVNKALAAVPMVGTEGVAAEMGITNLKMDELIVANQNYNHKMTAVLANILKATKEAKDGTLTERASNIAKKAKIINKSIKAIQACERTRDAYRKLNDKGWTSANMIRAIQAFDIALTSLEEVAEIISNASKIYKDQREELNKAEAKVIDIENMIDEMEDQARQELAEVYGNKYMHELNSAFFNSIYTFDQLDENSAREKFNVNMTSAKSALINFKNTMWICLVIFALLSATSAIGKIYFLGEENFLVKYMIAWITGIIICAMLGGVIELIVLPSLS